MVGYGADSQILRREFYVSYTACVLNTSKASFLPLNQELIQMAKDLGLYDWLRERSGVLDGTVEDMREGIQQLHDRGIHNLMLLPGIGMDKGDYARLLGKEVLPHFS